MYFEGEKLQEMF